MPARGKNGKPNPRFPLFPPHLEIPQHQRDSHIPTASTTTLFIQDRTENAALQPSGPGVGQIKPPKWARCSCQTHDYTDLLKTQRCQISMSRKASPWENGRC